MYVSERLHHDSIVHVNLDGTYTVTVTLHAYTENYHSIGCSISMYIVELHL